MSSTTNPKFWTALSATLLLTSVSLAQGIQTRRDATVLYGSAANCTCPATIDHKRVQKATPEWKTIRSERVRKGSARHDLLVSAMNTRIKKATTDAAEKEGCDCVVRKGDIKNANGLKVQDLTSKVIEEMGS